MPLFRKPRSPFFWYDFRYNGKRYRGSTKEQTKAAARTFEADLLMKLERGSSISFRGRRAPLLRDFLLEFLAYVEANQHLAAKTKRYYRNGVRMLQETALREFPIDRLTRSVVAAVQFRGSGATANNAVRTLRASLSYAVELRTLHAAPSLQLYQERARDQVFTPEHERAFLEHADRNMADFFILLMDSGMRPDEACRFEWDWTDWIRNVIKIPDGKTGAARREVPMSTRVREMLIARMKWLRESEWKNYRAMKFAFPSKHEGKHVSSMSHAFNRTKRAAKLPAALVMYCTRHTFGTDLAELGNPKLTMITMGHEDLKTTARYQHPQTHKVASFIDERNAKRKSATTGQDGHTFGHTSTTVN